MPFETLVSAEQLRHLIDDGSVLVVDCTFDLTEPTAGRLAFEAGHIPGARYLHLDDDLAGPAGSGGRHPLPDPQLFAATLRRIGLRAGQQVVAYDEAGGAFAARLWWLLRWIGHKSVALLDGGKPSWIADGYSLEKGSTPVEPSDFTVTATAIDQVIDADTLLANLSTRDLLVVDARTPERFAGVPNALDPVAGHIPGARNRFFKDNLGADGRFKSPIALAAEFHAVFDGVPPEQVVLQCGSGVTACHNAFALALAGLSGARLYPGSWSEWIGDANRPVETGPGRT